MRPERDPLGVRDVLLKGTGVSRPCGQVENFPVSGRRERRDWSAPMPSSKKRLPLRNMTVRILTGSGEKRWFLQQMRPCREICRPVPAGCFPAGAGDIVQHERERGDRKPGAWRSWRKRADYAF